MVGGMHGRGHAWQGVCMVGACMAEGGHAWQGACVARGHAWQGTCVAGGMHGRGGDMCAMHAPHDIMT